MLLDAAPYGSSSSSSFWINPEPLIITLAITAGIEFCRPAFTRQQGCAVYRATIDDLGLGASVIYQAWQVASPRVDEPVGDLVCGSSQYDRSR